MGRRGKLSLSARSWMRHERYGLRHERHEALLSVTYALRCVTKRHEIPTKKQVKRHDALRSVTSVTKTSRKRHEALRCVTERHDIKRHERHEGGIHDLAFVHREDPLHPSLSIDRHLFYMR